MAQVLLSEWRALAPDQRDHGVALPPKMHATLGEVLQKESGSEWKAVEDSRVVVVGDVHGCADELERLLQACEFQPGRDVLVLVGDLVHKGPRSCEVIRRARELCSVSVRGNHDVQSLAACVARRALRAAALSACENGASVAVGRTLAELQEVGVWPMTRVAATSARAPPLEVIESLTGDYAWTDGLQDEDLRYLAGLPASIRLPAPFSLPPNEAPVLIVHAGLVPGVPLSAQRCVDMHSLREVRRAAGGGWQRADAAIEGGSAVPWAATWEGPEHIVFGHDAPRTPPPPCSLAPQGFVRRPRGVQQHPHATGLDSAAVNGKRLTALILPGGALVSVPAAALYATPRWEGQG